MNSHLKSWIEHCKQYASANNKKYSECLKDNQCREMYHKQKGSSKVSQQEVEVDLELIKVKPNKRKSK